MKNLRSFLLEEGRKQKVEAPAGYRHASVSGKISNIGLQSIRDFGQGVDSSGEIISYKDWNKSSASKIKKNMKLGSINDRSLKALIQVAVFGGSEGSKTLQKVFTNWKKTADGYAISLVKDWQYMAKTSKSTEKVIMFWINSLWNVYVIDENQSQGELEYFFSNTSFIVRVPKKDKK